MNIEQIKKTTFSPGLLLVLGVVLGGAIVTVLLAKTPVFQNIAYKQKQQQPQMTQTPIATASVTATPTPSLSDEEQLRTATQVASGIPANKFEFSLGEIQGTLAKGSLKNSDDMGGAAWFAAKVNGTWVVAYIGQGVPECLKVQQYSFPTTWISHCVGPNGKTKAL